MAERVLTQRDLNRALLARQLLLERVGLPLPRVLERLAGIQNQYAPNGYVRLWSCVEGFQRDDLTRALERRSVIQGTLMRETIHLVSRRDYPLFAAAIRQSGREWRLRVDKREDDREVAELARKLRAHMRERTLTRKELDAFVGKTPGVGHWLDMVRVPPAGTWEQRGAHTYALAEEWVGPLDASEDAGIEHLVRRYLGGFGPARIDDVAAWSGVPKRRLAPVVERMRLRRFRDEDGKELLDLPRAPLPDPETPAPVRFLPTWDATLLVHARGTGILPEQYRPVVFDVKMPPSYPTFLVDGAVAGTWRYESGRIRIEPFRRLPREARRELAEEAERLAAFHVDERVETRRAVRPRVEAMATREKQAVFGPELFSFLQELRANNDREWFAANKHRYEEHVLEPALDFIEAFAPRLEKISQHFRADARPSGGSLFRIYRDTRFSKDKTPYKTNVGIHFRHQRAKDAHAPGYYLHIGPGEVFAGGGIWHPDTHAANRIREAIVAEPDRWRRATRAGTFAKRLQLGGDSLKRVPSWADADHPYADDLRRKDFFGSTRLSDADVLAPGFVDEYARICRAAAPLMQFLCDALDVPY